MSERLFPLHASLPVERLVITDPRPKPEMSQAEADRRIATALRDNGPRGTGIDLARLVVR